MVEILFTETEQMIVTAAHLYRADQTYWAAGAAEPFMATMLAQKLYHPDLTFLTEDGVVGPQTYLPLEPLMSMVSSRSGYRAYQWTTMNVVKWHASAGYVDYGVLAALQVDPFGNFNSSMLGGTYERPGRRFGGAGGAHEIAALCWHTLLMVEQSKRKFVEQVDFITSPGYLDGSPGARERAGMPRGTGPWRVVTDKALFDYEPQTRRMRLIGVVPWSSVEEVLDNMGFTPAVAERVETLAAPTQAELDLLRSRIDPGSQTIGVGNWISVEEPE